MSKNRYGYIDSLRAIAALLVVWLHTAEVFLAPSGGRIGSSPLFDLAYYLDFGRVGVVIFFIVSGFVIPSSLKGEVPSGLRNFVVKRFFRLYPLYWASIPFGILALWTIWNKPVSLGLVLSNLTMIQSLFDQELIIGLYWTLTVELLFYFLCAALFYLGLLKSEKALSVILMAFLSFSFTFFNFANVGHFETFDFFHVTRYGSYTLTYMGFMFLGALLRKWLSDEGIGWWGKCAISIFIITWMWQSIHASIDYINEAGSYEALKNTLRYNIAIATFLLMTTIFKIQSKSIAWLGVISYSIYLIHPIVMYSLFWLTRYDAFHGWSMSAYILSVMLMTIALSYFSYRFIEVPFIDIGNKIAKKK
ncbi:O-acetyltransferase [Erwinia phage vB_EhrS_59]|uniref:Acyltransferase n=1 Tax=Erwinia phage vB_EhrS_59 TaxID=2283025 RepID=A0A4Y1NT57_9CAUD|nr:O-acetyltransferase [Erwinia phage vB_EhrS_59]AXH43540.1 acyltransferase [Erwinia phage vB_EhrS_59]